jgi:hypothetical protein
VEIGELTAVPIPDEGEDSKCPFSHDPPKPTEKNELGGIGSTLGKNMAKGEGICHESRPDGALRQGDKEADPRERELDPVKQIRIKVNGVDVKLQGSDLPLLYPLTCAAHHLIPAQESLKKCKDILKYMCKKGEPQDFRDGKAAKPEAAKEAKVWGNVAYNVNGCHNGVWLPGNYAVGGGTGGADIWKSKANAARNEEAGNKNWVDALDLAVDDWDRGEDDPEEEAADAMKRALGAAERQEFMLSGKNHEIAPGNPKWAYVKAAMDVTGAQFHDRHEKFSKEVIDYLGKIATAYKDRHSKSLRSCEQCKKAARPEGMTENEVGPPFAIVDRLKTAADFFKGYLLAPNGVLGIKSGNKTVTAKNIYTSGWVEAWFEDHEEHRR